MSVVLRVVSNANRGRQITIANPEFKIGRDPTCQLRPASTDISRIHCAIVQRAGRAFVRDYGSSNGTVLNGRRLVNGELELEEGDLIQVGPLAFRISLGRAVAAAETKFDLKPQRVEDETDTLPSPLLGDEEPSMDQTQVVPQTDLQRPVVESPGDAGLAISLD
jgi:pSer/pThr/pTyr-binding forkhead associated (FHA) protein